MWLEAKIMFSVIAEVFIGIVLSQILMVNILFGMLLFMSIGLIFIGDVLIGSRIKHTHVDKVIDSPPAGMEFATLVTLNGMLDFIWASKKPYGKREFMYHGQEASYVNKGDSQIHTINGNYGCLVHENHDENISLDEAKVAEEISRDFQTDDIKDVYYKAKKLEEINRGVDLIGR